MADFKLQYLENGRRRSFKFGENAFKAYPNILVQSKKYGLNALFKLGQWY